MPYWKSALAGPCATWLHGRQHGNTPAGDRHEHWGYGRGHALAGFSDCTTQTGTRATACTFMPFAQLSVMDVISLALTPSGPPICKTRSAGHGWEHDTAAHHPVALNCHALSVLTSACTPSYEI